VIHPNPDEAHLAQDDILQAVVEDSALSDLQRAHLAWCPHCRSSKERLEQELTRLGQLARRYCPAPQRRITLVERRPQPAFFSRGFVFSAAAVAAAILVTLGVFLIRSQPQGNVGNLAQNMVEAERLMTEVNNLADNALPPVYLDIVGETDLSADEDFMNFLIPNTDGAPKISAAAVKGSKLC
jgi:hypothetical protein